MKEKVPLVAACVLHVIRQRVAGDESRKTLLESIMGYLISSVITASLPALQSRKKKKVTCLHADVDQTSCVP